MKETPMLTPDEIIDSIKGKEKDYTKRRYSVSLIKNIIDDSKKFFTDLADKIIEIKNHTFSVKVDNQVELPDTQKVEGEVSLKEIRSFMVGMDSIITKLESVKKEITSQTQGLSKSLKPDKVDFSDLKKAIQAIKIPETKIPDYPKQIEISNLKELKKYFDDLAKKFDIKIPEVKIPDYPKKIEVSNFPEVKEVEEEKMTGFYWNKNEAGDVTEIVEQYPSGEVVSKGWAIGRVKITDGR